MNYPSIKSRNRAAAELVADAWSVLEESGAIAGAEQARKLLRRSLVILDEPVGLELRQIKQRLSASEREEIEDVA